MVLKDGRRYWLRPQVGVLRSCTACAGTVPYEWIGRARGERDGRVSCTCSRSGRAFAWRFTCPWPCRVLPELGA